ncbi:MoxR family ATPase [Streptomyces sp. HUAS 31]|uniref:AAA family ATPase n=1 Tax=Streptomyces TaxID=1883 RepID=UPI002305D699|nr:MoxR family ATPase [Streptomyces sp. HUAS 31]WCE00386.1 MoxR family ATPase [Streptomyces sp. HUAS 31]
MSDNDTAPQRRPDPEREAPDRRDGRVYIMQDDLELAVDVALAANRPLLLRGEPGSGKSSVAAYVARKRNWRYYEQVVTSRTEGKDLLWTYDHVRRLGDAQALRAGERLDDARYVQPGPLWWAFDPVSAGQAARRGRDGGFHPWAVANEGRSGNCSVILIDEIDKADPDMPNSLLVPLGSHRFTVAETGRRVARNSGPKPPGNDEEGQLLIVITTNEERELPQAFLRRCIVHTLQAHTDTRLVSIAEAHFLDEYGEFTAAERELAGQLTRKVDELRPQASEKGLRPPSTAEFLDALRACHELGITPEDPRWDAVQELTLVKPQQWGGTR